MMNYKDFDTIKINFSQRYSNFKFQRKYFFNKYSEINTEIKFLSLKYSNLIFLKSINVFKQLKPSELNHSIILANLLNPKGNHLQGKLFLESFLKIITTPDIYVPSDDIWEVTAEKDRYDIRIKNIDNTKIIIIENKSNWAKDQDNQLYRYWYYGIYLLQQYYEKLNKPLFSKIIYLSPSDYKPPTQQSISRPTDWDNNLPEFIPPNLITTIFFNEHIVKWLDLCLDSLSKDTDIYFYIKQYRDFWRN